MGAVEVLGGEVLVVGCPGLAAELADEVGEWVGELIEKFGGWVVGLVGGVW